MLVVAAGVFDGGRDGWRGSQAKSRGKQEYEHSTSMYVLLRPSVFYMLPNTTNLCNIYS